MTNERFATRRLFLMAAVLGLALVASGPGGADTRAVAPQDEYAQIDTRLALETIQRLTEGSARQRARAIKRIESRPQEYAPPVFYLLSHVLFEEGKKDEAAFWFYAGQLRARFDANRCADRSARQAVAVLNQQFGPAINQYTFQDLAKLEALIPRVVEWDRKTPHEYDHRWINLHGMRAMMSGLGGGDSGPLSLPAAEWEAIAEETRTNYLNDFHQGIRELKQSGPQQSD